MQTCPHTHTKSVFFLPLDKDELIITDALLRDLCSLAKIARVEGLLSFQVAQGSEESGSSRLGYSLHSDDDSEERKTSSRLITNASSGVNRASCVLRCVGSHDDET